MVMKALVVLAAMLAGSAALSASAPVPVPAAGEREPDVQTVVEPAKASAHKIGRAVDLQLGTSRDGAPLLSAWIVSSTVPPLPPA